MNASILSQIDSIAEEGIRLKAYPGCHVMILREGLPVYNKCFGSYTYEGKEQVKENSLYDLALNSPDNGIDKRPSAYALSKNKSAT